MKMAVIISVWLQDNTNTDLHHLHALSRRFHLQKESSNVIQKRKLDHIFFMAMIVLFQHLKEVLICVLLMKQMNLNFLLHTLVPLQGETRIEPQGQETRLKTKVSPVRVKQRGVITRGAQPLGGEVYCCDASGITHISLSPAPPAKT